MSTDHYRKKSFPLSLALGITQTLSSNELQITNFLAPFSFDDQKTFLFNTNHLSIISNNPFPKQRRVNPVLISLAVRRALALKSHTPFPVIITVNNHKEGEAIATELLSLAPESKLYNMIYTLKDKFTKDFLVSHHTHADFILLTYHKLRELVLKKACPATEQIVFIHPLTKHNCTDRVIFLDDIIGGLHRHKCRRPYFSHLFDNTSFPLLTREEHKELLVVNECLYFRCEEPKRNYFNNPLKEMLLFLTDEHIYLFILRELFRRRKNLKELFARFKQSITYKLLLFSNNLYPSFFSSTSPLIDFNPLEEKGIIEKKIYGKIAKALNLFSKGATKTIIGEVNYSISTGAKEITWYEPFLSAPYLQLVEKKIDRNYYLTSLGEAILIQSTHKKGVQRGFSLFLRDMASALYKDKKPYAKLSIKEIIDFCCMLLGVDLIEIPGQLKEALDEGTESISLDHYIQLESLIIDKVSSKMKSYEGMATLELLSAFEELMDENAYTFFQQLKDQNKQRKETLRENLREEIKKQAQYSILAVKDLCQKYKLDDQYIRKELEKLVKEEEIICTRITNCGGNIAVKYCTQELLEKHPYLEKTCGICKFYNKEFKTCSFLRLVAANTPSALPSESLKYTIKPIEEYTTSCQFFEEITIYEQTTKGIRFTLTREELTNKTQKFSGDFLLGQTDEVTYHCLTCRKVIKEFGSSNELFFPRRRIKCPNCATGYFKEIEQKIVIQTEHRHLLRMKYYELTGTIPEILDEKKPYNAVEIFDTETVKLEREKDGTLILNIRNQKTPLSGVQSIYFAGRQYTDLEQQLLTILQNEPEKYRYRVKRSQKEECREIKQTDKKEIASENLTPKKYFFIQNLFSFLSKHEILNSSIATTRHLSNIGGIVYLWKLAIRENYPLEQINKQLFEMIDLLMKVQTGVKTSYYGRQLEALSNNFFFELLMEEGANVGLWSYGRVISRLVFDGFLTFSSKISNAYSPFDALVNQLVKTFRSKIDALFRKVGLKPEKLGPGLYHRRKTKSAIDKLGLYFDLIEPVRVLVLITLYEAMKKGILTCEDCSFVLGSSNQEIYQVKFSSLEKIDQLVEEILATPVLYNDKIIDFKSVFEKYLLSFKQAISNCYNYYTKDRKLSSETILQLFQKANFQPFIFCPESCVIELSQVNRFTSKFAMYFEGIETRVLDELNFRTEKRKELLEKWMENNRFEKGSKVKLTKYQNTRLERSLIVALYLLYQGLQNELFFGYYSTKNIQTALGLTQNQIQRLLMQMAEQELVLKTKRSKSCFYQLNLENKAIKELLFNLGLIPSENKEQEEILRKNSLNILTRTTKLCEKYLNSSKDFHRKTCWINWNPTTTIQQVFNYLLGNLNVCKQVLNILD